MDEEKTKIKSFKDLNAWKEGHLLVLDIYRYTKNFPKEETFGLTNQIRRAVVSITSNMAEGFSRSSYKEKINFYGIALGSLTEVENQLTIAKDIGYLENNAFESMNLRTNVLNKIINGLIKKSRSFINLSLILILASCFMLQVDLANAESTFWPVQSIDTMKYSRDLAQEKINDKKFDAIIDSQIKAIAETGATHVTIATPYDKEFIPILTRWVSSAREYGLKVWFRGNFSGWEKWFGYPKITRGEHTKKTEQFILNNKGLFEDGDIFTACPECENGGPGDPRFNGDLIGHRQFLITEHEIMAGAFKKINKNVVYNYNSMNGDVAFLVMNRATAKALDGVITIDHYVRTKERLISDITKLSAQGGGAKIVLGEIGVPIPDIHGKMSPIDQAKWMQDVFVELAKMPEIEAINYWVNIGGSTELWDSKLTPRPIVNVVNDFYKPNQITGYVIDELGRPIKDVVISNEYSSVTTKNTGFFSIPYISYLKTKLVFEQSAFHSQEINIDSYDDKPLEIVLKKGQESFVFKLLKNLHQLANLLTSFF